VALGHRNCGAVAAAVEAYQEDPSGGTLPDGPLGAVLRPIFFPALQVAGDAFNSVHGEGAAQDEGSQAAINELAVYLNAAWAGHEVREWAVRQGSSVFTKVRVGYGVFDVSDFRVRARPPAGYRYERTRAATDALLAAPPGSLDELHALGVEIARNLEAVAGGAEVRPEALPQFYGAG
jgi:hypothetical protein